MSEKWHDDHKKAIAEKWTQCPQISARKQELLSKWAIGQVGINALCEAHAHAEKELAELKADRVAISQQLSDALDALFVSNQKLAEARAEIERKDKLVEQMREALHLADDLIDEYAADYEHRDNVDEVRDEIKAALRAAERGEQA